MWEAVGRCGRMWERVRTGESVVGEAGEVGEWENGRMGECGRVRGGGCELHTVKGGKGVKGGGVCGR